MGCHSLFQGIFPTQGFNPGLPRCGQILYHLNHQSGADCPLYSKLTQSHTQTFKVIFIVVYPRRLGKVPCAIVKVAQSCPTLCDPCPWNSPGQNPGAGSLSLLQGVFPTQGSNPGLPRCRQNLYQLSHKGSPRILEWAACPFSRGSSQPRKRTGVSCTAGGFFTSCAAREACAIEGTLLLSILSVIVCVC